MKIKVFEAFAGYGSQALALKRLKERHADFDYEVVGISEIDKFALQAYEALHGHCPNFGDISKIDWDKVPDFDLFTYSSPCQDFSLAGKRQGGEEGSGTRSSLLWECRKAIIAKKPKWLLMENVAALVQGKFLPLFNKWQTELESYGYRNYAKVLNAKDFGVPQNRERVFLVSVLGDCQFNFPCGEGKDVRLKDILETDVDESYYLREEATGRVTRDNKGFRGSKPLGGEDISGTLLASYDKNPRGAPYIIDRTIYYKGKAMRDGDGVYLSDSEAFTKKGLPQTSRTLKASKHDAGVVDGDRIRKFTPKESFRLMGLQDDEIDIIQSANISNSQMYHMAGNSIVVNVLDGIFENMFYPPKVREINLF